MYNCSAIVQQKYLHMHCEHCTIYVQNIQEDLSNFHHILTIYMDCLREGMLSSCTFEYWIDLHPFLPPSLSFFSVFLIRRTRGGTQGQDRKGRRPAVLLKNVR